MCLFRIRSHCRTPCSNPDGFPAHTDCWHSRTFVCQIHLLFYHLDLITIEADRRLKGMIACKFMIHNHDSSGPILLYDHKDLLCWVKIQQSRGRRITCLSTSSHVTQLHLQLRWQSAHSGLFIYDWLFIENAQAHS